MSARERKAAHNRLNEGLQGWRTRWVLDGSGVRCVACQVSQLAETARIPFIHLDNCIKKSVFSTHPWLELRGILRDLAPDPLA